MGQAVLDGARSDLHRQPIDTDGEGDEILPWNEAPIRLLASGSEELCGDKGQESEISLHIHDEVENLGAAANLVR